MKLSGAISHGPNLLLLYPQGGERDFSMIDDGSAILNAAPWMNTQTRSERPSILPWISKDDNLESFFTWLQKHHHHHHHHFSGNALFRSPLPPLLLSHWIYCLARITCR